jgi:acetolactate synthase-1/2/3 large subunit
MDLPGYRLPAPPDPTKLMMAAAAINSSQRPIIYGGGGLVASDASDAIRAFAENTKIPVALTLQGLGAFPADHYLSLGMLGMHGTVYSNFAINSADLLLALGVRFDDRVTGKLSEFAKHGRIIHVDIDASEINKNKTAHLAFNCDVGTFVREITPLVDGSDLRSWHDQIDAWKHADPMAYDQRDDVIMPQYVIDMFSRMAPDDVIVSTGVGQHQMWAAQWMKFRRPRAWITSGGLGSMGFGLPAAMGAAAAHPGRLVVDIDGDGSFLMNIQELATCYCENLPVKAIVLNNQHLGMVVQWEDRFHQGNRAHTYLGPVDHPEATGQGQGRLPEVPYPDFVALAAGFGVPARRIREKSEVEPALRELIASPGPYVLDVMVPYQEHVLPMIPAGMTYRDIIKS